MAAQVEDAALDGGLTLLDTAATHVVICLNEPTALSLATVGQANALGYKSWGAGNAFGSPASAAPSGRKVSSVAITDGTVTTTGTASWWAAISGTGAVYARGTLSAAQGLTAGNTFSLGSFDITIPAHA